MPIPRAPGASASGDAPTDDFSSAASQHDLSDFHRWLAYPEPGVTRSSIERFVLLMEAIKSKVTASNEWRDAALRPRQSRLAVLERVRWWLDKPQFCSADNAVYCLVMLTWFCAAAGGRHANDEDLLAFAQTMKVLIPAVTAFKSAIMFEQVHWAVIRLCSCLASLADGTLYPTAAPDASVASGASAASASEAFNSMLLDDALPFLLRSLAVYHGHGAVVGAAVGTVAREARAALYALRDRSTVFASSVAVQAAKMAFSGAGTERGVAALLEVCRNVCVSQSAVVAAGGVPMLTLVCDAVKQTAATAGLPLHTAAAQSTEPFNKHAVLRFRCVLEQASGAINNISCTESVRQQLRAAPMPLLSHVLSIATSALRWYPKYQLTVEQALLVLINPCCVLACYDMTAVEMGVRMGVLEAITLVIAATPLHSTGVHSADADERAVEANFKAAVRIHSLAAEAIEHYARQPGFVSGKRGTIKRLLTEWMGVFVRYQSAVTGAGSDVTAPAREPASPGPASAPAAEAAAASAPHTGTHPASPTPVSLPAPLRPFPVPESLYTRFGSMCTALQMAADKHAALSCTHSGSAPLLRPARALAPVDSGPATPAAAVAGSSGQAVHHTAAGAAYDDDAECCACSAFGTGHSDTDQCMQFCVTDPPHLDVPSPDVNDGFSVLDQGWKQHILELLAAVEEACG